MDVFLALAVALVVIAVLCIAGLAIYLGGKYPANPTATLSDTLFIPKIFFFLSLSPRDVLAEWRLEREGHVRALATRQCNGNVT